MTDRAGSRTRLLAPEEGASNRFVIADSDGEGIGFVDFAPRDGELDVRWIELMEGRRGWGHGSDAVRLLEEEAARRWGARLVRADVPVGIGLALYFWLRLGYRPAVPRKDAGDFIAMVRETADQEARSGSRG